MIDILNRWTRAMMFRSETADSVGAALLEALKTRANLTHADLTGADLTHANLTDANLKRATMPHGETWEQYLSEVVPALLVAGGKDLSEVACTEHWDCHDWDNCPMAVAFGITNDSEGPRLLQPRIREFVRLFDANLIPMSTVEAKP
jgi:uncharacterized protein YjbI with pentapeptide repeats